MKYRKDSVKSIYEYALKLLGKSLSQLVELPEGIANSRNRGDLGSLVEKYYFFSNAKINTRHYVFQLTLISLKLHF